MRKICFMLCLLLGASASFGQEISASAANLRWRSIKGVVTAQNVDNPVSANIHSGTFAWTTLGGHASVDLSSGDTSFVVKGLVINGTAFSGTPGPITAVTGTLVCNAGAKNESTSDTAPVSLNAQGDARFYGRIANIPSSCENPLFLLRIANLDGANGLWIATGASRTTGAR